MDTHCDSYVCSALYAMACNFPSEQQQKQLHENDGSDECFSVHIVPWAREIHASHFIVTFAVTVRRHLSEKSMHTRTHAHTHQKISRIIFCWKNQNGIFIYFGTSQWIQHLNANWIQNSWLHEREIRRQGKLCECCTNRYAQQSRKEAIFLIFGSCNFNL